MNRLMSIAFAACGLICQIDGQNGNGKGNGNGNATPKSCTVNNKTYANCPPGLLKQANREAARNAASINKKGVNKRFAGLKPATASKSPLAHVSTLAAAISIATPSLAGASTAVAAATQLPTATPDYFGSPNWALSQLPEIDALTGAVLPNTGIRKFVDTLPGLCALGTNNLGQCLPLASPDTTTFPGSDFYRIGLKEYQLQMHRDLPGGLSATRLRGYLQLDNNNNPPAGQQQYLGPLILATRNRPVRVLFKNMISTDLNIPTDTTYMGAGIVSDGSHSAMASQKRATLHLHGGNTPWISDGTTHQWTTPAGGDGQPAVKGFAKGVSATDVPDMVPPGCGTGAKCVNPNPSATDGMETFYWTNQQSGRLMFYHDHAYGLTRLNVYAGEAAGYLVVDPNEERALQAATVPGTIVTDPATGGIVSADLAHMIPLVIQDKTFVPDSATNPGGQLSALDPTWDPIKWGGGGSLWFPHVYTPNQNPADVSGANGFGRWDWGPWFWPPQNPATLAAQDFACTSGATPPAGWAFPPLKCPGVPFAGAANDANAAAAHVPASPSGTPESFMDTMTVNGTAYPTLTVDPAAYRFHVLSVGNDRTLNLGLYVAEPLTISLTTGGSGYTTATSAVVAGCTAAPTTTVNVLNGAVDSIKAVLPAGATCTNPKVTIVGFGTGAAAIASTNTEVKMIPAIRSVSGGTLPDCTQQPAMAGGGLVTALLDATGNPLNGTGLPTGGSSSAACWPMYNSTYGYTAGPYGPVSWGNADARPEGLPDPATAGPPIIQIGTEGGMLPAPVVIPSTPVSYDYNKRSITVLNILNHGLLLGPAERASIIVDFSAFAGKTLILYNDAPAPVPAGDPRLDYFTNDPDQSPTGGAPTTMAGYGPNTRTVMQIVVRNTTPNRSFSLPALTAALSGLFASTQDKIQVPEPGYPAGNGQGVAEYSRIQDTSLTLNAVGPLCPTPPCSQPMLPKTIQELFTLDYGRMNATLGVELPFSNFTTQTTVPYGYNDPPTEIFKDGETQLWKITHNGVDTHFIHFHLFNVQVINRVGWDGAVKPPDPNELSFKDTVRMNPLEDIIVALQPMRQSGFPFDIPNSVRPLNPAAALNTTSPIDYTNVDPTGQPANVVNDLVNFGWEYVWHCHILGHEENDMMRGMILAVAPNQPTLTATSSGTTVTLNWTIPASPQYTGFTIQRSTDPTFPAASTISKTVGPTPLNYTDSIPTVGPYYYRIQANNVVGYTRTYAAPAAGYPHVSADSPFSASVGIGAGPVLSGSPASLTFSTALTVTSAPQLVTLSNTGGGPLTFTSTPQISGAGFAIGTNSCVSPLLAGQTCTIALTFTPASATPLTTTGSFSVTSDGGTVTVALTGNLIVPTYTLTPTALTFSSTVGVASAPQSATITNTGTSPLPFSTGPVLVGNGFAVSGNTCANPLPAGQSCQVTMTFTPPAPPPTTITGSMTINISAPGTSQSVVLTGNILVPTYTVSPSALSFTSTVNVRTAAQVLTIANSGTQTLTLTSAPAVTGANANQFASTTTCGTTLAIGGQCTVNVTFMPTVASPLTKTASIAINMAAPAASTSVPLTGFTNAPILTATPTALTFSSALNVASASQTVNISNTGTAAATNVSAVLGGTNANQFSRASTCGTTLGAGASCTVSVTFLPTAATPATKTATLTINGAAPVVAPVVNLTGNIVIPTFTVTPANLTLNSPLNTTSAAQPVLVTNTSTVNLTISSISLTGANPNQFAQTNGCVGTLGPGLNCTINVTFRPTSASPLQKLATLNVNVAAPATSATVALTGNVTVPVFSAAPPAIDFSTQAVSGGWSAAQTITLTATNAAPVTGINVTFTGTNSGQFRRNGGTCTATLAAGASCTILVQFNPGSTGLKSAILNTNPAAPAANVQVTLSGTGI